MAAPFALPGPRIRLSSLQSFSHHRTNVPSFARLIPLLIIVIAGFALYQLLTGLMLAARGEWPFAALYVVLSIAGWALARTLWINKRKLTAPRE